MLPYYLPQRLKLVLLSLAEAVEREIQPHECIFELAEDKTYYQFKVIGGEPSIVAWATNDPNGGNLHPTYSLPFNTLIINVRADLVIWECSTGYLGQICYYKKREPATHYIPEQIKAGELSFQLRPYGLGSGSCIAVEPMMGYSTVMQVLTIAAQKSVQKSLRKRLDKRTKEYRFLSICGYLDDDDPD
jgi:hypothetical protein